MLGSGKVIEGPGKTSSFLSEVPNLSAIEFPKHIAELPLWVSQLTALQTLDLRNCWYLETLPLGYLLDFPQLKRLECQGCVNLSSPPQEICEQGGEAVLAFLKEVRRSGQFSKSMTLFLIGDGEAGKTSVISALKSDAGRTNYIRADHRTIGIDVSVWEPREFDTAFRVYDLAGQAVYSKTHQFFLLRRAIYLFVWRAGGVEDTSLRRAVIYWLESLYMRMPGYYMMLVATHIDEVNADTLEAQCSCVKSTVQDWLQSLAVRIRGAKTPCVWGGGESMRVNCLAGDNIDVLRVAVINFTKTMPWYKEALPASWIKLVDRLQLRCRASAEAHEHYLDWRTYTSLADSCGVGRGMLNSATKFLHDSGQIRYFGDLSREGDPNNGTLQSTVYISPIWMMNVMKGLIRHDRQAMTNFFLQQQNKVMLRYINQLNLYGKLHKDLAPFLWPSQPVSGEFWSFVRGKSKREAELWAEDVITSNEHLERAMALLKGFDLIVEVFPDFIVPGVLAPAMVPCTPAFDIDQCPFQVQYTYCAIPAGAFDSIVVRMIKKYPAAFDFTPASANFYNKSREIVQIVCYKTTTGASSSVSEECLMFRSSSEKMMREVDKEVVNMERFFAGLARLSRQERSDGSRLWHPPRPWNVYVSPHEMPTATVPFSSCVFCGNSNVLPPIVLHGETWQSYVDADKEIGCSKCNRKRRVMDLRTTFQLSEVRPCPCCYEFGGVGVFNAGECRLKYKEQSLMNTVTCYVCMSMGRLGQISISDVAPAEIFVSGISALDSKWKARACNLVTSIEVEAGVMCYIGSERESFALNLKRAIYVLFILSDAHISSLEFREDLLLALQLGKRIISVLMPNLNTETTDSASCGWSGPRDSSYWQHAVRLQVGTVTIGRDYAVADPRLLKHFPAWGWPPYATADSIAGETADLTTKVMSDLAEHLHRPGRLDIYSDFSMLGIRLSYFDHFISEFGGPEAFAGLATQAVMANIVFPATLGSKLSFCEQLQADGKGKWVGQAEWFYSHAWRFLFLDVVEAAKLFFQTDISAGMDPVLWFDVFSVSQHKSSARPFEWWNSVFQSAIGSIGKVLMLMQPFPCAKTGTPAWTTLTRVWCVFELFACESTLSRFEVTMTQEMSDSFVSALLHGDNAFLQSLLGIDCAVSNAVVPQDRERVFEVIQRSIGFPLLNSMVLRVLERWVYAEILNQMKNADPGKMDQYLQTMSSLSILCLNHRVKIFGVDHDDAVLSRCVVDCVLKAEKEPEYLDYLVNRGGKALSDDAEKMQNAAKAAMAARQTSKEDATFETERGRHKVADVVLPAQHTSGCSGCGCCTLA